MGKMLKRLSKKYRGFAVLARLGRPADDDMTLLSHRELCVPRECELGTVQITPPQQF